MKKLVYYLSGSAILVLMALRGCTLLRFQPATHSEYATVSPLSTAPTLNAIHLPLTPGTPPPPFTGRIAGRVTDLQHQPLAGLNVVLYQPAQDVSGVSYWDVAATTKTDMTGVYTFTNLPPSTYRVGFIDERQPPHFLAAYYDKAVNLDMATDVHVGVGAAITNTDAQLARFGRITGRVTDLDENPLPDIVVTVYGDQVPLVGAVTTDSAGAYTVTGLAAGNYQITYHDPFQPARYNGETYDNAASFENARWIAVGAGATITGINAQLPATGSISGVVTNQEGQPLANINVTVSYPGAFEANAYIDAGFSTTDATGVYTVSGLPVGAFHVGFVDANQPPHYASLYYPAAVTAESATLISVTEEARIGGINVQLARSGSGTR